MTKVIKTLNILKKEIKILKENKLKINFVPTMGFLHNGHLKLVKESKKCKGITLVSIFINRLQFDQKHDFENYPFNLKKDIDSLKKLDVDYIFVPKIDSFLNKDFSSLIVIDKFNLMLCGALRKNHFNGVATIITKFLVNICPDYIYLGKKDFQQILVISKLIKDFGFRTIVKSFNTVRQKNGLALSSRNSLLSEKNKLVAPMIYDVLVKIRKEINQGKFEVTRLDYFKMLLKKKSFKVNYLEILKEYDLTDLDNVANKARVFISVNLKNLNLIDNLHLGKLKINYKTISKD